MIPVTLDGLDHYALPYTPDWGSAMSATFRVEADQVESLTKREARRPLGATLRVTDFSLDYFLSGDSAAEFRSALRVLQDTPVRIPFWPDEAGYLGLGSRWGMNWEAAGNVSEVTADFTLGGAVPTLLGYFTEPPTFQAATPGHVASRVRFKESSPATEALVPANQVWTEGPQIAARNIDLWPFPLDWTQAIDAGQVEVAVDRPAAGVGRQNASAAYPQIGRRKPVFPVQLQGDGVAKLLRFFLDRQGPTEAFWLPGWLAECQLAADTSAASLDITLEDASLVADHGYLAFYTDSGEIITRAITARAGNVLTLESSPGTLPAAGTILCTLLLCRFAGGEITVRFSGPVATAQIGFVEVPQEYVTPVGETIGTTLGATPAEAWLILIRHGDEEEYYTSFEADLNYGGHAYAATPLNNPQITDGSALDKSTANFQLRYRAGGILEKFIRERLMDRVEVEIYSCMPGTDPVTNVARIFTGVASKPDFAGAFVTLSCDSSGRLFDKKIQQTLLQATDNYALFESRFDGGDGLDKVDFTFTAEVTAVADRVLTLDSITWPGGDLPDLPDNFFALGYIERPAPNRIRLPIISSTALAAGVVTVELAFAEDGIVAPEAGWTLVPGYDGQWDTLHTRFPTANFGGFPLMPATEPTLVAMKKSTSTGKK